LGSLVLIAVLQTGYEDIEDEQGALAGKKKKSE
jgi:hypothetical protein